jgi:hypothetical protein
MNAQAPETPELPEASRTNRSLLEAELETRRRRAQPSEIRFDIWPDREVTAFRQIRNQIVRVAE